MDDFIFSLVAVGKFYVQEIESIYYSLKTKNYQVRILTDTPEVFDKNDVTIYHKSNFNYFDKIYFSLDLIQRYQKSVIYFDGSHHVDFEKLINRIAEKNVHFMYQENWPNGSFFHYKDDKCFRFLLEYLDYRKIPILDYQTISEKIMVFNKEINHELVKSELEKIQPVFDFISLMNDMTYTKPFVIGGAEGLALSIILENNQIPHSKFG